MLRPTFFTVCTAMTEISAVVSPRSQFGPSTPAMSSAPLMPPLSWSRNCQTIVQATSDTTTGEKKTVRKNAVPRSRWLSSTASSSASDRLIATRPTEKSAVARSTGIRFASSASAE